MRRNNNKNEYRRRQRFQAKVKRAKAEEETPLKNHLKQKGGQTIKLQKEVRQQQQWEIR